MSDGNANFEVKSARAKKAYFCTHQPGWTWLSYMRKGNTQSESCTLARLSLDLRLQQKLEKCFFLWKTIVFKKHLTLNRSYSGVPKYIFKGEIVYKSGDLVYFKCKCRSWTKYWLSTILRAFYNSFVSWKDLQTNTTHTSIHSILCPVTGFSSWAVSQAELIATVA